MYIVSTILHKYRKYRIQYSHDHQNHHKHHPDPSLSIYTLEDLHPHPNYLIIKLKNKFISILYLL
jgi:hypothetical protein